MTSMRLYTAEEYGALNLDDAKTELVRGVIVYEVRDQPRLPHAYTAGEIGYAIRHYLEMHPIGRFGVRTCLSSLTHAPRECGTGKSRT
jgi:hypothetical protein